MGLSMDYYRIYFFAGHLRLAMWSSQDNVTIQIIYAGDNDPMMNSGKLTWRTGKSTNQLAMASINILNYRMVTITQIENDYWICYYIQIGNNYHQLLIMKPLYHDTSHLPVITHNDATIYGNNDICTMHHSPWFWVIPRIEVAAYRDNTLGHALYATEEEWAYHE